ncbi:ABC transporter substrate-binding protein [Halarchaeum nitratireducens]|uniref:Fe/B12 periplasmic-binding domain-containing protein n=1 Tax=Halarchaeum nitratireducens TaxID=489913 RepID=A0A830GDH1_9EURY|nr:MULTISPECIES: ABC transporter substrate-binding protein [Halarchaeum]MBP2251091.1 iron complex transport system substrate-binding protein [Halarchaeum solikamskense]GGN22161.1 hypothetical protein GCM10009021_24520 [Halarchaeum nitratireducens]
MADDDAEHEAPTRREYVTYGGAVVGGGLLAGCSGGGGMDETTTTVGGDTTTEATTPSDSSYSVTMAPMGDVEFTESPQAAFTILAHHADMALALGHGDDVNAIFNPSLFEGLYNRFLNGLDGVSVQWADLYGSWNPGKEQLYELDSDVHLADPAKVATMDSWTTADIDEVHENVAPWFGNSFSGQHGEPPAEWADDYEYYDLWEIFERVARVFQEEERYQALAAVHEDLLSTIRSNLPPADERPRTGRVLISPSGVSEGIWAYSMNGPGFYRAHTRALGVEDAFADMRVGAQIDLEALVEADPDVILRTGGVSPGANWTQVKTELRTDSVAQQIPAVKNDRIYPLGVRFGGPIMNLFQLEMGAKELYPEQFGEWPAYDGGAYPDFSKEDQLFDHQRVADIIKGEF